MSIEPRRSGATASRHTRPPFRLLRVSLLAAAIGVAAGGIAFVLYHAILLSSNLFFYQRFTSAVISPQFNTLGAGVIIVTVAGGLIVGLLARYGSPKIRGHGIPEAMEAVLVGRSRIEPRVAFFKPLSAAIAIGAGGPFGAEGPIIQTGGAIGSIIGQALHSTVSERKVLLACGAAAGMAATFGTPLAAVVLAIELLLFEFTSRSFIPLVIAATLAAAVRGIIMDPGPMFSPGQLEFDIVGGFPYYLILGAICGFTAVVLTRALYFAEDQFERLPINPMWWPAIGGLGLGVIGYFVPRVFGVGYDTIGEILSGRLPLQLLLILIVAKGAALIIALGSGTSGGLLAPTFMVSAAIGSAFASTANAVIPGTHLSPGAFALVAMGAVFGAASRSTFAFIIFAFELTRDYDAVLPLMLVAVIADGIGLLFLKNSIMTEKLARRGLRISTDYEADALRHVTVDAVMNPDPVMINATVDARDAADQFRDTDYLLLVDEAGTLAGIVTRSDIARAMDRGELHGPVTRIATARLVVTHPDESVHAALLLMLESGVGQLPVVRAEDPLRILGVLGRTEVLAARRGRFDDDYAVEPGWLEERIRRREPFGL